MINQLLGALVLDVLQLLVLRKPSIITDVQFAKNITVLNADANIIKTKPVHSTESVRTTQKTIKNFEEFVAGSKFKQCPKCKFWVDRI